MPCLVKVRGGMQMILAGEASFAQIALEHLTLVDDDTSLQKMRLHCHFAKLFLQLALDDAAVERCLTAAGDPLEQVKSLNRH